jgi:WD40 repeat protein
MELVGDASSSGAAIMASIPCRLAVALGLTLLSAAAAVEPPRKDPYGDPLPAGALARLGTQRFRTLSCVDPILSPDGKRVAFFGNPPSIVLLDTATGKEVRRLPTDLAGLQRLAFSPDGQTLAGIDQHGRLPLYDLAPGGGVRNLEIGKSVYMPMLAFSANSKIVAMAAGEWGKTTIMIAWEAATGRRLTSVIPLQDASAFVTLSADGKRLATWGAHAGRDQKPPQTIQLWETTSGKELRRITVAGDAVLSVAFSPDGKQLAVTEWWSTVGIWDLDTGKLVRRWEVPPGTGWHVSYFPDGKLLVAGPRAGALQVWDPVTGRRLHVAEGPGADLASVAFLPDGRILALGVSKQALCLWDVCSGRELTPRGGHTAAITSLAFCPDGKTLVSAAADGVRWWDVGLGKELRHRVARGSDSPSPGFLAQYILSPDGRFLASPGQGEPVLRIRDLATDTEVFSVGVFQRFYNEMPAAFSADGAAFASLKGWFTNDGCEGGISIHDTTTGQEKRFLNTKIGRMHHVALSTAGRKVGLFVGQHVARVANEVIVWDAETGKETCRIAGVCWDAPLAFNPDGSLLATSGPIEPIRIVDTATGADWITLETAKVNNAGAIAFSPDGRTLAVGDRSQLAQEAAVFVWEVASGKLRAEYAGHRGHVNAMAFSPDGLRLATGGNDTTILLWDVSGQGEAADYKPAVRELDGLWEDLRGSDARKAHRALARLAAVPAEAVALVRKRLPPAPGKPPPAAQMEAWIASLDDDAFDVREKASRSLAEAGQAARPVLEKALAAKPSPEKKRRLEELLVGLKQTKASPEMVLPARALELLERLRTPEARRLLEELAAGNPSAPLTADATATLRRLANRP